MNLGIRSQLLAGFGTLIGLLAIVGGAGWYSTNKLAGDVEDIYNNQLRGAISLANSESAL